MTTSADPASPDPGRRPPREHAERDELLFFSNRLREGVVRTTAGLSEEQLRAPGVPSGTSLLGLVWHLAEMETHWFRRVFAGADLPITGALQAPDNLSATEVVAAYRAACGQSDQVVRDADGLDAVSQGTARLPASTAADAPPAGARLVSLREVAVHMIEETARHAGHADIIREQLDGATDL